MVPGSGCQLKAVPGASWGWFGCCVFRGQPVTSWCFPYNGSMLRYHTNIRMAKVPGAAFLGDSALHDAYSCHCQAKAF